MFQGEFSPPPTGWLGKPLDEAEQNPHSIFSQRLFQRNTNILVSIFRNGRARTPAAIWKNSIGKTADVKQQLQYVYAYLAAFRGISWRIHVHSVILSISYSEATFASLKSRTKSTLGTSCLY